MESIIEIQAELKRTRKAATELAWLLTKTYTEKIEELEIEIKYLRDKLEGYEKGN